MKKKFIAAALALVMVLSIAPLSVFAQSEADYGTITVNGNGTILSEPEIALVRIGVSLTETTVREAVNETVAVIDKVVEALLEAGVEEVDIRTASYSMWPQEDWNLQWQYRDVTGPVIVGFNITHMLDVTIRDIDAVGDVLAAAAEAGANRNDGIRFTAANESELQLEALTLAIKDAQAKADAIASALGIELGAPISVNEGFAHFDPFWSMGGGMVRMAGEMMAMDASFASVPVQTGQIGVSANVSVTFKIPR